MGIIKVHPLADFCLEEEGGVMFSIVTDHSNQIQLTLFCFVISYSEEELERRKQ